MDAILTRAADVPAMPAPRRSFGRLLTTLALAALERLTLPQRDVPPDFYRFPPL